MHWQTSCRNHLSNRNSSTSRLRSSQVPHQALGKRSQVDPEKGLGMWAVGGGTGVS